MAGSGHFFTNFDFSPLFFGNLSKKHPGPSPVFRSPLHGTQGPLASQGGRAAERLLSSLARVLTGGTSSPWPPHIGASSALALSAPRRRLTALLVLGMLLVPLRRSALLPLLGKI